MEIKPELSEAYSITVQRINAILTDLFYSINWIEASKSMFSGCTLGVTPRCLTSVLNGFSQPVQLQFSEKNLLDASEFMNAVYEDMT